jgi:hypothetical protein
VNTPLRFNQTEVELKVGRESVLSPRRHVVLTFGAGCAHEAGNVSPAGRRDRPILIKLQSEL